jgi:hypothetical protein
MQLVSKFADTPLKIEVSFWLTKCQFDLSTKLNARQMTNDLLFSYALLEIHERVSGVHHWHFRMENRSEPREDTVSGVGDTGRLTVSGIGNRLMHSVWDSLSCKIWPREKARSMFAAKNGPPLWWAKLIFGPTGPFFYPGFTVTLQNWEQKFLKWCTYWIKVATPPW